MASLLSWIWILFQVILIFNAAIVIHEFGHLLAAKWRGLRVDRFQVWFGKPIWKKTIGGIQYGLGTIPLGGFVMIPQMVNPSALEGVIEGPLPPPAQPWDKIIVAFAGPLFSFLFAAVISVAVWKVGYPSNDLQPVIGYVVPDMPAAKAGFKIGDRVVEIDGEPVDQFFRGNNSIIKRTALSEGKTIHYVVERDGKRINIESDFRQSASTLTKRSGIRQAGIAPAMTLTVTKIENTEAAKKIPNRLQIGDTLISFEGAPVRSFSALLPNKAEKGQLVVERKGKEVSFPVMLPAMEGDRPAVIPEKAAAQKLLDFASAPPIDTHPTPADQIVDSVSQIYKTFRGLIFGSVSANHLGGPIGIGKIYFDLLSEPSGWKLALWFSVILNVNLALMNLIPLPILDGGHIVMALYEWVRGKPLPQGVLDFLQRIVFLALLAFFFYVTWYDVFSLKSEEPRPFWIEPLSAS